MTVDRNKRLKARGTRFEYRVRDLLRENGWTVFRSAGSQSSADLIAMRPGCHDVMVQCKTMELPALSKHEIADLIFYRDELHKTIFIVGREKSHHMAFFTLDETGKLVRTIYEWVNQ